MGSGDAVEAACSRWEKGHTYIPGAVNFILSGRAGTAILGNVGMPVDVSYRI